MNAGAFDREMKDVVKNVEALDKKGSIHKLDASDIEFRYRGSSLMDEGYIVTRAEISLSRADTEDIERKSEELLKRRQGLSIGGACVSEKHAGFIVNNGGASSCDIYELMKRVQETVSDRYGVTLEPEVRLLGKFE